MSAHPSPPPADPPPPGGDERAAFEASRVDEPARRAPRFGLRALMVGITLAALVLGAGSAFGWWLPLSVLYLALIVLPTSALVSGAVFARGRAQAFCIGAAIGWYLVAEVMGASWGLFRSPWGLISMAVFPLAGGLAGGYAAVLTRRQVRRRGLDRPDA